MPEPFAVSDLSPSSLEREAAQRNRAGGGFGRENGATNRDWLRQRNGVVLTLYHCPEQQQEEEEGSVPVATAAPFVYIYGVCVYV